MGWDGMDEKGRAGKGREGKVGGRKVGVFCEMGHRGTDLEIRPTGVVELSIGE
jgi:hypothetical protein